MTRMQRRSAQALGALVMPSNYDAQLVTTQRMLPDGTIGIFVGDYQLTQQDLQNLEAWRQAGIADKQRQYDIQLAKQALELAAQPPAAGWASAGPGAPVSTNPGAALALSYANSITDPVGRTQVADAVSEMIRTQTAHLTPGQAGYVAPIAVGTGAYYPVTGFPEVGADSAADFGPQTGPAPGAASSDISKLVLAALGALALFN